MNRAVLHWGIFLKVLLVAVGLNTTAVLPKVQTVIQWDIYDTVGNRLDR